MEAKKHTWSDNGALENVTNAHGDDKMEDDEFINANLDIDKTKEIPLNQDLDNDSELGALSVRS